jgi:hypothetical protein
MDTTPKMMSTDELENMRSRYEHATDGKHVRQLLAHIDALEQSLALMHAKSDERDDEIIREARRETWLEAAKVVEDMWGTAFHADRARELDYNTALTDAAAELRSRAQAVEALSQKEGDR